jgi:phage shock protein C
MFCTQCGTELAAEDLYCSQCAKPTGVGRPSQPETRAERPRLVRDMRNKKIAGVCAGFARYLDVDVVLVRIIWLALALGAGVGFIAYVVAWIIMPKERLAAAPAPDYVRHEA